ncbi:hypothetical protein JJL56_02080 [Azospirillum sp. YIM DDC1]|uniref:Uncharacterized protein n=1 Tax=Azospirillum aestuarii TaxID=2802052 RepID=A0ABS1HS50_9PROT|nr:hypothetical protein [Azospirillum aestuarii]MBK4717648.1 hypothetical protein [Azospirillum aestuarii]
MARRLETPIKHRRIPSTPSVDIVETVAAEAVKHPRRAVERIAICDPAEWTNDVLVLRPTAERYFPGKTITLNERGAVAVQPYGSAVFFRPLLLAVGNLDSLHAAFVRVAEALDGPGFVVAGDVFEKADPRSITRRKTGRKAVKRGSNVIERGRPRGLQDAGRRWLVLDLDKVANLSGVDPRRNPADALAYLRGLLPPELRKARCSWQWSSTLALRDDQDRPLPADQVPPTLSAHLRFWLDRPLTESERAALLKRINAHVVAELAQRGAPVAAGAKPVDPRTAIYNQPIYTVRPRFDDHRLADPFPNAARFGLTAEGNDQVDVGALLDELPMPLSAAARALTEEEKQARREARRTARAAKQATTQPAAIPFPASLRSGRLAGSTPPSAPSSAPTAVVVSLGDERRSRRERELQQAYGDGTQRSVARNRELFRFRALRDIERIVSHRRATIPEWGDGVPEGLRDPVLTVVASLLSYTETPGGLRAAIAEFAQRLMAPDWFAAEWVTAGADRAIIERALMAAEGLATTYRGRGQDPRYDFGKSTIIDLLDVTEEEMIVLELEALTTEAVRSDRRRRAAGRPTAEERHAQTAEAIKPWLAAGVSRATWFRQRAAERAMEVAADPVRLLATVDSKEGQREGCGKPGGDAFCPPTDEITVAEREFAAEKRAAEEAGLVWDAENAIPWDSSTWWVPAERLSASRVALKSGRRSSVHHGYDVPEDRPHAPSWPDRVSAADSDRWRLHGPPAAA